MCFSVRYEKGSKSWLCWLTFPWRQKAKDWNWYSQRKVIYHISVFPIAYCRALGKWVSVHGYLSGILLKRTVFYMYRIKRMSHETALVGQEGAVWNSKACEFLVYIPKVNTGVGSIKRTALRDWVRLKVLYCWKGLINDASEVLTIFKKIRQILDWWMSICILLVSSSPQMFQKAVQYP